MADSMSHADDAVLLGGNAEDLGRFYLRYEDAILLFFRRRVPRADLAADLAAETFARVLEARDRFDPGRGPARAWLFGIANHVFADSLRRGRVQDSARRRLGLERLVVDDEALARVDELSGDSATKALWALPSEQREAVVGRVLAGESYDELAARLRCSHSVARQRVSRGLRALRHLLEGAT